MPKLTVKNSHKNLLIDILPFNNSLKLLHSVNYNVLRRQFKC